LKQDCGYCGFWSTVFGENVGAMVIQWKRMVRFEDSFLFLSPKFNDYDLVDFGVMTRFIRLKT
jgi:hypothetical protein